MYSNQEHPMPNERIPNPVVTDLVGIVCDQSIHVFTFTMFAVHDDHQSLHIIRRYIYIYIYACVFVLINAKDGNGKQELVVVTRTPSIQIYELLGGGSSRLIKRKEASLLSSTSRLSKGRMPVALSVGYIDTYSEDVSREQVIVVLTDDWTLICFDASLNLVWENTLSYILMV